MHCAGFLLLCMATFAPRTIENLRVHKLTLPNENLKLKKCSRYSWELYTVDYQRAVTTGIVN